MEHQIDRMDMPQLAGLNALADRAHARRPPIGEIDAQQPVCSPRRIDHRRHFRATAAERLLAEDGNAPVQRPDGLFGVKRARRRDDDAVQRLLQQRVDIVQLHGAGGQRPGLRAIVGQCVADRRHRDGV